MRSKSYDKKLAEKMRDPELAKAVIIHAVENGDSIEEALTIAITGVGIREFSDQSGIKMQNVSQFVQGKRAFGYKTLAKCLAVFGLKFAVTEDKAA